jgi:fatty-acyl-CoA synthase
MAVAIVNSPERQKSDLSSLDRISIGGSASSPALVKEVEQKLGCTCYSGYGLTETSPVLSVSLSKPGAEWHGEQRWNGQAMTGYAIPGVELRVVDAEERDVPHDGKSIGEVVARGDGVMQGYWKQPEATSQAMRGGWFHTGDMASMDKDDYILVVDRKKDIIISGGENISSIEVENALATHPAVAEAAVVGAPDALWGEIPVAFIVPKQGQEITQNDLADFASERLAKFKLPKRYIFATDPLPKGGTGKILKRELREQFWQGKDRRVQGG